MQNFSDTQSVGRDNKLITDKIFSKLTWPRNLNTPTKMQEMCTGICKIINLLCLEL